MASLTPSPKMQFFDANGNPLAGGKLYTYTAGGTSTPQATYTDYGGGTPNANPVILDSRGEASVWLGSSTYYMVLKDSTDVQIWTADNIGGPDVATLAALAASGGSALVGFLQSGSGTVARTVQDKARESVSVFDFMTAAQRADVTARTELVDVTAAIQAAAAAIQAAGGGTLLFPPGVYSVFGSTTGTLCQFTGLDGIACLGYGATLKVPSGKAITASEGYFFNFSACTNILVDGFATDGPVLDVSTTTVKGYEFVRCVNGCRNISMPHNRVKNSLSGFISSKAAGDPDSDRTQNIHIGILDIENCWYGVNGQYSGDFTKVDLLRTNGVHRSFFFYGATNLDAKIWSKNHVGSCDVAVSALGGVAAENIKIDYFSGTDSNACSVGPAIKLSFGNQTASVLRNVDVHLNVAYAAAGTTGGAAVFIEKLDNTGSPDATDRGHILENLKISGTINGSSSYNSGGCIVTDTLATWGTGDYFRNISLENLRINGVSATSNINLVLGNVQDHILLKNVYSNYAIKIQNASGAYGQPPRAAVMRMENVKCLNRWAYDGASSSMPLDILRATATPTAIPVGWSGRQIGNAGLGGGGQWDLPAATPGLEYTFVRTDAQVMDINPDGTEVIRGGTAGQMLRMNAAGNVVRVSCYVAGTWEVVHAQGAYSFV